MKHIFDDIEGIAFFIMEIGFIKEDGKEGIKESKKFKKWKKKKPDKKEEKEEKTIETTPHPFKRIYK
jgi:hypothetical protein